MRYIIEHMEEGFSPWVRLEYATIAREVSGHGLILTSVSPKVAVPTEIENTSLVTPLEVTELGKLIPDFDKARVCLLDPSAESELRPEDAPLYDYFLFGGILGDHPPRDRTGELRKLGFAGRHLGKVQMTTDTAVRVTQMVVDGQQPLQHIPFVDFPEIKFNRHESTEMPFRYVKGPSGEPVMPPGMRELISKDSEKSLDDLL